MTTAQPAEDRAQMVDAQIAARGIKDTRVLDAMRAIPRHLFVPEDLQPNAYEDRPLDIGCGQTISQPYIVALMTELLRIQPEDRILEVGTGSGYQTAILTHLAAEVVTIERVRSLSESALERLKQLGCSNVTLLVGDGSAGCPEHAPYDGIVVTAAGPRTPTSLRDQLNVGARLICPVGSREMQKLHIIERTEDGFDETQSIGCMFVPLIGEEGWGE